jgi:hypothetical protein
MQRSILVAVVCFSFVEFAHGRTITNFHLAAQSALQPVTTGSVNNDNATTASPNQILLPFNGPGAPYTATTLDPIDFIFNVQNSGGTTEYFITSSIINSSGIIWSGIQVQLGRGFGANFQLGGGLVIPEIQPPDFDTPGKDPAPTNSAYPLLSHSPVQIDFGLTSTPSGPASAFFMTFSIDTPDDMTSGGYTDFTIRQVPVPVPEPAGWQLLAIAAVGLCANRGVRAKRFVSRS